MPNLKKLEETAYALEPRYREMRQFHVCAIYLRGRMLSLACNSIKTHPVVKKYSYHENAAVHSEIRAMLKLGYREDYHKLDIAVLRIDMNNRLNDSCPCVGCTHMIQSLGFRNVFHTNKEGIWIKSKAKELVPRPIKGL